MHRTIHLLLMLTPLLAATAAVAQPLTGGYQQRPHCLAHAVVAPRAVSQRTVYGEVNTPSSLYLYVSKQQYTLFVYERGVLGDKLIAAYPVCVGANKGNKSRKGDHCTPESSDGRPFTICQITDASSWRHNFNDGRGMVLAYGPWFLRLEGNYVGNSIGIHGSGVNESSVPGRGSEGCIRLRDKDIEHLKSQYAFVGMEVYIDED